VVNRQKSVQFNDWAQLMRAPGSRMYVSPVRARFTNVGLQALTVRNCTCGMQGSVLWCSPHPAVLAALSHANSQLTR
jgi:hypothetical protein